MAERGFQFRAAQGVAVGYPTQLKRGANRVGPPAGAHYFLPGGYVGRAHRRRFFAAAAAPVALLQIACERAVLRSKGQHRREGQLEFTTRSLAQIGVNLESPIGNDLARIEEVMRIKRSLDFAHYAQQAVAELLSHELSPRDPDAVFAGQRAFEAGDQGGHLSRELAELLHVVG